MIYLQEIVIVIVHKIGRVRASYTAREKLAAIAYAKAHRNRADGQEFNTNEKNVREWHRQKDSLMKVNKACQANRGKGAHYPALEKKLLEFVTDRRGQGVGVSTIEIHMEAMKITREDAAMVNFKASQKWVYRFLRKNRLSIRHKTHIAQKLPEDF